jgi:CheY-like chemotaxis protein
MKVLVIEDTACMARAFEALLQESGHQVHLCVGCHSLEPLILKSLDGSATALDSSSFDAVFCDGQLIGSIEGPAIVAELTRLKIPSFGISTMEGYNQAMRAAGAKGGTNKAVALLLVMSGILTPELICADAALVLDEAKVDQCVKNKELRSQADALLMRFLS